MGKLNEKATIRTTNKCGKPAYSMADKTKLVTQVLTSFFNEKKFYGDNTKDMLATANRVIQADPQFVARLAVFARREFNMRTVAHVLTAMLAKAPEGKPFTRATVRGVCVRGDDATEIMAYYLSKFGKPVPNALKRGIADVIKGFDAYTLSKYKGTGNAVKMRDLLCLAHPKPANSEQAAIWKACLEGTLETPVTWESELSANGNTRDSWERLIDSGKVGYMALLRNLRNIIQANPGNIEKVWAKIENPEAVRKSRQLPFRFLSAYKELPPHAGSRAFDALENAVDAAVENIQKIPGTTVIAVDISGSMCDRVSTKSDVRCAEIGMMLGLLANRICENSIFMTFNTGLYQVRVSDRSGILYACTHEAKAAGGTNMALPLVYMTNNNIEADRVVIISDNECNGRWGTAPVQRYADEYRRKTGRNIWVHALDLQGYGTQQFHGPRTNIICGWSEKALDFIALAEQGVDALERRIANYDLGKYGVANI